MHFYVEYSKISACNYQILLFFANKNLEKGVSY